TRGETIRGIALTGGRIATGVAGIAGAAIVAAGIGLVPWPAFSVVPPAVTVAPSAARQQLVCSGGFQTVGADSADVNAISVVGDARVLRSEGTETELLPESSGQQNSGGVVLTAPAEAAPLVATQVQKIASETAAGVVSSPCVPATAESWLVGGSTALGNTSVLVLSNPSEVDATVRLELFGADGPIQAQGLGGIRVEPGRQVSVPLAGFAPNETRPVVHVVSVGARVVAQIDTAMVNGITLAGADTIAPSLPPATELVIPGLVVDASISAAESGEGADRAATVRLLAPSQDATVSVRVVGDVRSVEKDLSVDVSAGEVVDVALTDLPSGNYSVFVSSTAPVVAAAQSALATPEGIDFAWFAPTTPLGDTAVIPVVDGGTALIHLSNPTADEVRVRIADGPAVTVPAGGSTSVGLAVGLQRLSNTAGLYASVSLTGPGAFASSAVLGPQPLVGSLAVYTR
ncbi:MAG TPA: DUF5719 family protein, partial [Microbacteriaceae bacterium]|nr:DUF5719 family protein [Microbacteriaceae bacterium]